MCAYKFRTRRNALQERLHNTQMLVKNVTYLETHSVLSPKWHISSSQKDDVRYELGGNISENQCWHYLIWSTVSLLNSTCTWFYNITSIFTKTVLTWVKLNSTAERQNKTAKYVRGPVWLSLKVKHFHFLMETGAITLPDIWLPWVTRLCWGTMNVRLICLLSCCTS